MQGFNSMTLVGRLINPESKVIETSNGSRQMLSWSMAVNDPQDRQNKEKTSWFRVVAWGKPAEVIEQYCTEVDSTTGNLVAQKGAAVLVIGPVSVQKWTGRNGERGTTVQLTVQQFQLIGSNNSLTGEDEGGNGHKASAQLVKPKASSKPKVVEPVDLDRLPF